MGKHPGILELLTFGTIIYGFGPPYPSLTTDLRQIFSGMCRADRIFCYWKIKFLDVLCLVQDLDKIFSKQRQFKYAIKIIIQALDQQNQLSLLLFTFRSGPDLLQSCLHWLKVFLLLCSDWSSQWKQKKLVNKTFQPITAQKIQIQSEINKNQIY